MIFYVVTEYHYPNWTYLYSMADTCRIYLLEQVFACICLVIMYGFKLYFEGIIDSYWQYSVTSGTLKGVLNYINE